MMIGLVVCLFAGPPAFPQAATGLLAEPGETIAIAGFCPVRSRSGPPPGLMYLSAGLIGVGLAGLLPRRTERGP